ARPRARRWERPSRTRPPPPRRSQERYSRRADRRRVRCALACAHNPVGADRAVRIGIAVDLALEVLEDEIVALRSHDVIGKQRDLSAAARSIDHVGRHGVAGRMAAQSLHDLKAFVDARAEMRGARYWIALIEVVRPDTALPRTVEEGLQ